MKSYLLIIAFVFINISGTVLAERFDDKVLDSVYQGCVNEASARGNLNDKTKADCRCATNVLKNNLSQDDWDSISNHFAAGKAFDQHPTIQKLIPQIVKCAE